MHPYKRSVRVSDLIKEEVADIIMNRLKDPRLGFITVTEARVSNDLRHAKIFFSVLEEEKKDESLKILTSSARFIRSELAKKVRIKFIPDIVFKIDESIEYGAKINKILSNIKSSTPSSHNDENLA
ncbi:MAG: 30S ribosome-binding factor RbfA [Thermodesulfovibrionia bacterium]|nr:30S ribosome-binding factor RbfA [Thermodesulfovibrionia bacterium]